MSDTIGISMAGGIAQPAANATTRGADEERLRRSARELEGVFVVQLLHAMRATVPEGGFSGGGTGEEMFTAILDEHLAGEVPARWHHGIGEALYRQLRAAAVRPAEAGGEDARD